MSSLQLLRHAAGLAKASSRANFAAAYRLSSTSTEGSGSSEFDEKMLQFLACPLSKKPLRYDSSTNELISDEIGVAYPIRNGIPLLVPDDGRMIKKSDVTKNASSEEKS